MTNLVNVTIAGIEYTGTVVDMNATNAWVAVEIDGYTDEYNFKHEEITATISEEEALAIMANDIAKEANQVFESDLDKLSKLFKESLVDGHDDTIILKGDNYELYVEVTEFEGKTVYNMETVNLNRLATKKVNRKIGEYDADFLDSATGNYITRKTLKGAIALIEKWLAK